ncbi:MAG: hypothetical protein LBI18_02065 [Planctomycetaceae bacterium]|jgi:hypothetical protein|nr:hypothetical protein [Planctomycetaceae bacterium]
MRLLTLLFVVFLVAPFVAAEEIVLLDATKPESETLLKTLNRQSSKLSVQDHSILVETEKSGQWPGFNMGKQNWNLVNCDSLVIEVANLDDQPITLHCRIDSPEIDFKTMSGTYTSSFSVEPGKTEPHKIMLPPIIPQQLKNKLFGMRGAPGGAKISATETKSGFHKDAVVGLTLFLNRPNRETKWSVRKIVATANEKEKSQQLSWSNMTPDEFFPMIDRFGQFKHENWYGKIHSEDDLKKNIVREAEDLAKHPSPNNRNQYGGYTNAPKFTATGHFRVEKINDVWWFVDPEGFLFWSHGTDCVGGHSASTPITDREFYFAELPDKNDTTFKSCYGKGSWAPHNYYEGRGTYTTFNFTQSNLIRKYGEHWQTTFIELAHQRLKSWGMNTIANWSDAKIYNLRKTPYTANMGSGGKSIAGSGGYWGKFPDPFSKEFEESVAKNAEKLAATTANDSWCLGYFVDNEISWGSERSLAIGTITSPADQPAKIVFLNDLKTKYNNDITKLNAVWATNYSDWDALLNSTEKPDEAKAKDDLDAFHKRVCEKYFKTIRDTLKRIAPNKLYFGCRFAWVNDTAILVSAEYCDVISFNKYRRDLAKFELPEGIDKPVIIGEFHFGALDRGMFHTGLVPTESQDKRAEAYENYVRSALEHPQIIGTHWFQYGDQATTGRGDGENYQIGLLSVTDTPYPETIDAVRRVGYSLYEIRLKQQSTTHLHQEKSEKRSN